MPGTIIYSRGFINNYVFYNFIIMLEERKISMMKQAIASAQKTLLSSIDEFLGSDEIILHDHDFAGKLPSLVVVFGSCLAAAKDAGMYLQNYREKKGAYPKVVCLPGISFGRCIKLGQPVDKWLMDILLQMGIPEDAFCTDVFNYPKMAPVDTLKEVIRKGHYKYIAVFSSRGYSVSTAIVLKEQIPTACFKFFYNPYISQEKLCLDSENLDEYGLDFILGEIIRLNMRRDTLPEYIQDHLMTMDVAKKYVKKGYVLGIQDHKEQEAVGLTNDQYKKLLEERLDNFEWLSEHEKAYQRTRRQVELLLKR